MPDPCYSLRVWNRHFEVVVTVWLVGLSACTAEGPAEPAIPAEPFIAFAADFEGFTSWPSVEVEPFTMDGGHRLGPTRVYLGGSLPREGEAFEVGAVVVKTVEDGSAEDWEVHGMVKRGGGYNAEGARGWEWFDLEFTSAGNLAIAWRGEGDAANPGGYVTTTGERIACNDCHVFAGARDHVFSLPELRAQLP